MTNQDNIDQWSKVPNHIIAEFGDEGDFSRQHLLNPQLFRLLGNVSGKKVLDAGSGNGYLSRKLAKMGATMTGIEPAQTLFEYAIQQELSQPLGISYLQQDLSQFQAKGQYDTVVSNMVFMDIPDYQSAIKKCTEALKPGGLFVFSITHPCFENSSDEFLAGGHIKITEYFQPYAKTMTFGDNYHRTLSEYVNFILQHSCQINEIVEPKLDSAITPDQKDHHIPSFLMLSATKSPS
jgi:2-polyprenyl-3-methyl-5-hydroxy-6-metoxy-1,4-benzoquinol methylase